MPSLRRWTGVALVLFVTTACGLQSSIAKADGVEQLRQRVDGIVGEARAQAGVTPGPLELQQALLAAIPPQPEGYRLGSPSTTNDVVRVDFAVDRKLDSYGPSRGTWILRMCVSVTAPVADLAQVTISDVDCSALATRAQEVVAYQ